MMHVAFLGLGAMGAPMAHRIRKKGFPLTVWNRSPERARPLLAEGAQAVPTPREAAETADVVCTMLADPAAVDAVATGPDGLVAGLGPGKLWLDFSTVAPADSRRYQAMARARGTEFCDVPVAGSVPAAKNGSLTILAGGDHPDLEVARPILDAVAQKVEWFGLVGQGSAMKLVNNLMYGVGLAAFGEALALAERLGLSEEKALAWLRTIPALPPYVLRKLDYWLAGGEPPHFSVALMEKDLRLMAEAGGEVMRVTAAARDDFRRARESGLGERDMAHVLTHLSGKDPRVR